MDADAIVVGAGLAGLVASCELVDAGHKIILLDQEGEQSLGGQAFWSFGGLFFVDSPEQRRLGIRDSQDLALQDWMGSAAFDREEDHWPRRWAEAYVAFAAGEKRAWLKARGLRWFPVVNWAERGDGSAAGHGNSVPRFHITWGTGPGLIAPFVRRALEARERGQLSMRFRHRVSQLTLSAGAIDGVKGEVLKPTDVRRGAPSTRESDGGFALKAQAVILASGGIGGNLDLVRQNWPERLGPPPGAMICGVPDHVDGRMLAVAEAVGAALINRDRMWHYTEGVENWQPLWSRHGIRILPGPSSLWLDAHGKRLPAPLFPGFDTLGTLAHICRSGCSHTWFILNHRIIRREFALSGSEQNPELTAASWWKLIASRLGGVPQPVRAFMDKGADFIVERNLDALIARMNKLTGADLLDATAIARLIEARDRDTRNAFGKDAQVTAIRAARNFVGDRLLRATKPHRLLDPSAGPLIAVRLHILTRKTLGGLHTDLAARVLGATNEPLGNLFAAGEAAGFGGGGMHGYRALEGSFLGGCIFSGRIAGRSAAALVR
jgi:uncharacterized protein